VNVAAAGADSEARAQRIYIVRHGQTERSADGTYSGRAEIPLTATGREQARRTGERLAGAGVDGVYSSPLSRAKHTAEAIANATGAELRIDDRLTEVDYGPLEGLNRESGGERYGASFRAWRSNPFGSPLPGMEPLDDALQRARSVTADALRASECPVLVGHQAILRLVLVALGRIGPDEYFSTRLQEADPIEIVAPAIRA